MVSGEKFSLTVLSPKIGMRIHKCDKKELKIIEEGSKSSLKLVIFVNFPNPEKVFLKFKFPFHTLQWRE